MRSRRTLPPINAGERTNRKRAFALLSSADAISLCASFFPLRPLAKRNENRLTIFIYYCTNSVNITTVIAWLNPILCLFHDRWLLRHCVNSPAESVNSALIHIAKCGFVLNVRGGENRMKYAVVQASQNVSGFLMLSNISFKSIVIPLLIVSQRCAAH